MPGPAPKPTALRILEGNPGKRPINELEPKPPAADITMPKSLQGYPVAEETWNELVPTLSAMGVFTQVDRSMFEKYCYMCQVYEDAKRDVDELGYYVRGKNGVDINKAVYIMEKAIKQIRSIGSDFGLTPSSRSRLMAIGNDQTAEDDPMEQILTGRWLS